MHTKLRAPMPDKLNSPSVEFFACGHARIRKDLEFASYYVDSVDSGEGSCSFPSSSSASHVSELGSLFEISNAPIDLVNTGHIFSFTCCSLATCQQLDIPGIDDVIVPKASTPFEDARKLDEIQYLLAQYEYGVVDLAFRFDSVQPELIESHHVRRVAWVWFDLLDQLFVFHRGRIIAIRPDALNMDGVRRIVTRMETSIRLGSPSFMIDIFYRIVKRKLDMLKVQVGELEWFVEKKLPSLELAADDRLGTIRIESQSSDDSSVRYSEEPDDHRIPCDDQFSDFDFSYEQEESINGNCGLLLNRHPAGLSNGQESEYNPFLQPPMRTQACSCCVSSDGSSYYSDSASPELPEARYATVSGYGSQRLDSYKSTPGEDSWSDSDFSKVSSANHLRDCQTTAPAYTTGPLHDFEFTFVFEGCTGTTFAELRRQFELDSYIASYQLWLNSFWTWNRGPTSAIHGTEFCFSLEQQMEQFYAELDPLL